MAIDISKPVIEGGWGISDDPYMDPNTAAQNSQRFNDNIASDQKIYLPGSSDPYPFDLISIRDVDNVEFYGVPGSNGNLPVIKFSNIRTCHLEIANADNFNIHDLNFDGRDAIHEGGVWVKDGATNGTLKRLKVYDAAEVSLVVGDSSSTNPANNIVVEDCTVYGQRVWDAQNSKAMILAGGYAEYITFKNCNTVSKQYYDNTKYSPADHFDSDNATNVEYHNCVADGSGFDEQTDERKGVGFWNEADLDKDQEASSTYYNCTAIQTDGGLGASQNSTAIAHNFYFDDCSWSGWSAWSFGTQVNLEIYDSTFDACYSYFEHHRGGGVIIEGAATIDNCEFINTPDGDNITLFSSDATNDKTVTIENNIFDRDIVGDPQSVATGTVEIRNNTFKRGADIKQGGGYTWNTYGNIFYDIATTTAVNRPTSAATVTVEYQNYVTSVQYNNGEYLNQMLVKTRDAINADTGAGITAAIDIYNNTITFLEKDPNSTDNEVMLIFDRFDWQNGDPFQPRNPTMS